MQASFSHSEEVFYRSHITIVFGFSILISAYQGVKPFSSQNPCACSLFFGFFPDYYENTRNYWPAFVYYHVKKVLNIKDRVKILLIWIVMKLSKLKISVLVHYVMNVPNIFLV